MQKDSLEGELKNAVFQNFVKHFPQNMGSKLPREGLWNSSNISAFTSLLFNNRKPGLVKTLWPVTITIGMFEIMIGSSILMYICCYTRDYDMMYNTENSNRHASFLTMFFFRVTAASIVSNLSFVGCVDLIITGSVLLFGLIMHRERPIRLYLFMSVILCVYIFVFACIKIHLSILAIEKNADVIINEALKYKIYLTTACILGIATLLGSVIHFIATMTVLTYYNLKFIQTGL